MRDISLRSVLVALVVAVLAASCGGGSPSNGGLPTHKDLDGYPAALLEGTLVQEGECIFVQSLDQRGRWLPIWPSGYSRTPEAVTKEGAEVLKIGSIVKLSGGEYHDSQYDFLRTLMAADVPATCRAAEYWLVGSVQPS